MSKSGYSSDEEARKLQRERCNHDLLKSEDEYVNMLEVVVKYIFKPLQQNAQRCKIKEKYVQFVFLFLEHMLQFHMNFLSVIRDAISVVPDFYKYSKFISMYSDYLQKYDEIIRVFASWRSMEFREFIRLRLQNDHVKKVIEQPTLSTLPWYLYRPFDRVKEYYRFLKDLDRLSKKGDDDREYLAKSLQRFKPVYRKIKQNEERLQTKTRLLEVQLQIHGDYKSLVSSDRFFLFQKPCQMKRKLLGKRYKRITIYVCSDLFLWASARGRFKGAYSFYANDLEIGLPKSGGKDSEFSIGLKSEKTKKLIVCASDVQRDRILANIQQAYQRCQDKLNSASAEQRAMILDKLARETHLAPEMSQSSMGTDHGVERSISMSESTTDIRNPPGGSKNYNGHASSNLRKIKENRTTDEFGTSRKRKNKWSGDPSTSRAAGGAVTPQGTGTKKKVAINVGGVHANGGGGGGGAAGADDDSKSDITEMKDDDRSAVPRKPPSESGSATSGTATGISTSTTGATTHTPLGYRENRLKDRSNKNHIRKARTPNGRRTNNPDSRDKRKNGSSERSSSLQSNGGAKRDRRKQKGKRMVNGNGGGGTNNDSEKKDPPKEPQTMEEYAILVRDLREQIATKDARIKNLEMSNASVRDTLLVTQNQLNRVQTDNDNLRKRMHSHPRAQSLALHDFRKLRARTLGLASPKGGYGSFKPRLSDGANGTVDSKLIAAHKRGFSNVSRSTNGASSPVHRTSSKKQPPAASSSGSSRTGSKRKNPHLRRASSTVGSARYFRS